MTITTRDSLLTIRGLSASVLLDENPHPARYRSRRGPRRDPRHHGPERRGQIHARPRGHGRCRLPRGRRLRRVRRPRHHRPSPRQALARGAVPQASRRPSESPACPCQASCAQPSPAATAKSSRASSSRSTCAPWPTSWTWIRRISTASWAWASRAARRRSWRCCSCCCWNRSLPSSTRRTRASTWTRWAWCRAASTRIRRATGGALVVITHNTRILEHLDVDRVHVMVRGRMVAEGDSSLIEIDQRSGLRAVRAGRCGSGARARRRALKGGTHD